MYHDEWPPGSLALPWAPHGAGLPGILKRRLDGFRHLLADLRGPLKLFVEGEDRAWFVRAVEIATRERSCLP
jgi:hypothetical protein